MPRAKMPRSKQFSVDSALSNAMRQFWSHGYHDTSLQNLVDCLGVGRGSIYDTFGSKRGLFLKALCHYFSSTKQRRGALLDRRPSSVDAIMDVFDCIFPEEAPNRSGCFVVNAAVELAPFDAQVGRLVSTAFQDIEHTFLQLIRQAQDAGQLSQDLDAALTARGLLSLYISLGVLVRATPDQSLLQQTRRHALALLDCAPPHPLSPVYTREGSGDA